MRANSSPPNRATRSCPLTFFARISAKSRKKRSPTRWPKRSLTSLNRSRSASARQKVVASPARLAPVPRRSPRRSNAGCRSASPRRAFRPPRSARGRSAAAAPAAATPRAGREHSASLSRMWRLSSISASTISLHGRRVRRAATEPRVGAIEAFGERVAFLRLGLDELGDRAQTMRRAARILLRLPACPRRGRLCGASPAPIARRPSATPSQPNRSSSAPGITSGNVEAQRRQRERAEKDDAERVDRSAGASEAAAARSSTAPLRLARPARWTGVRANDGIVG